jgi:excinuclease ABC subunit C
MKNNIKEKLKKLSKTPGVYIFKDKSEEILYIGKATNLKSRVGSYFPGRGDRHNVTAMMDKIHYIEIRKTETVLEALILEANLIKKHKPKYNIEGKDDKSFSYFVITSEEFPRVLIFRESDFSNKKYREKVYTKAKIYGPYTSKVQMLIALKIIRKIFPFHARSEKSEKGCLASQIGLCPGPYDGNISKTDYKKNIKGIRMILEGKKKRLVKTLEKEMKIFAKEENFEKAAEARNKIFALTHIQDIALISENRDAINRVSAGASMRIEAYDISNISGTFGVGSMVVFQGREENKSEYRKFKIKTIEGADDTGMMREILTRRFRNSWKLPNLIILDGGRGHVNMAEKVLEELGLNIPLIGVAKGPTRKIEDYKLVFSRKFPATNSHFSKEIRKILEDKKIIERITDEAHRFAISYHRKLREKIG